MNRSSRRPCPLGPWRTGQPDGPAPLVRRGASTFSGSYHTVLESSGGSPLEHDARTGRGTASSNRPLVRSRAQHRGRKRPSSGRRTACSSPPRPTLPSIPVSKQRRCFPAPTTTAYVRRVIRRRTSNGFAPRQKFSRSPEWTTDPALWRRLPSYRPRMTDSSAELTAVAFARPERRKSSAVVARPRFHQTACAAAPRLRTPRRLNPSPNRFPRPPGAGVARGPRIVPKEKKRSPSSALRGPMPMTFSPSPPVYRPRPRPRWASQHRGCCPTGLTAERSTPLEGRATSDRKPTAVAASSRQLEPAMPKRRTHARLLDSAGDDRPNGTGAPGPGRGT